MQLFEGHNATIKAVIIQIKLNHFCDKNSQKLFQATLKQPSSIFDFFFLKSSTIVGNPQEKLENATKC